MSWSSIVSSSNSSSLDDWVKTLPVVSIALLTVPATISVAAFVPSAELLIISCEISEVVEIPTKIKGLIIPIVSSVK